MPLPMIVTWGLILWLFNLLPASERVKTVVNIIAILGLFVFGVLRGISST